MKNNYTPCHLHTDASMLDGLIKIKELMPKLTSYGITACAITDHGNMFNALKFYNACVENNIKPLIGVEMYLCDKMSNKNAEDRKLNHIVLIAKDYPGYINLIKLVSLANIDGFYYKPRLDLTTIAKYSKGILALSACLQGEAQQLLLAGEYNKAREAFSSYKDIFGEDFYIELMRNGLQEQMRIEPSMIKLSKELDIKLIATTDSHYLNKEDSFSHEVALCIGTNQKILTMPETKDNPKGRLVFGSEDFYVKSPQEMNELYKDIPQALNATLEVAEKCNLEMPFRGVKLMKFNHPSGKAIDSFEYLKKLCRAGWKKRKINKYDKRYKNRIDYELDVIGKTRLSDYFLTVSDICSYADANGIARNMGRGSAGASLVSYLLGITQVDPIEYGLIFERFYNIGRGTVREINGDFYIDGSPADIDCDFEWAKRNKILEYIKSRWSNVCQIITFNTMSAKAAIKDVARVLGIDFTIANNITSFVPKGPDITIKDALAKSEKLREYAKEYKKLFAIAEKLEGCIRNASIHAAGVLISDVALDNLIPLAWDAKSKSVISGYDMGDCELSGLQKIDILGLRTIDVVKMTYELINGGTNGKKLEVNKR